MEKTLSIIIFIILLISCTPFPDQAYLGGEYVPSDRIWSSMGDASLKESSGADLIHATLNTLIFNLPAHYGAFIKIFDANTGNKWILYSFANRYKKPTYPTTGWTLGQVIGWIIRIGILILIFVWILRLYKLKK